MINTYGLRPLEFPRVFLAPAVGERRRQSIELSDVSVTAVTRVQLLLPTHCAQGGWHQRRVINVHALDRIGIVLPVLVRHGGHQLGLLGRDRFFSGQFIGFGRLRLLCCLVLLLRRGRLRPSLLGRRRRL